MKRLVLCLWVSALGAAAISLGASQATPPAGPPVVIFDTVKGNIEMELFAADAPKSVAHIVGLVRKGFYRGLRFHRVTASLAQVGDPQTRNMQLQAYWGTGTSGDPIGVAEISKKHSHVRGAVGLAYAGGPQYADSQFYIMKRASTSLDGEYAVIGMVTAGMDVVDKIEVTDVVRNAYVKGEGPK